MNYESDKKTTEDNNSGVFTFDKVMDEVTQEDMYLISARDTVRNFTKGYNGTIFAYCQSGSGKTYCMLGPEEVVDEIKSGAKIDEEI